MFGTVLTILFTLLLAYVLWRAGWVSIRGRRLSRRLRLGIGAGLWSIFALGRLIGHDGSGALAAGFEFAGMFLLGWVFLTALALLAIDLITLFGLLLRRWLARLRAAALVAGGLLAVFALIQGLRAPAVVEHEVVLAGLPAALDGTVLVALSDTHLGTQLGGAWFAARMRQVEALQPDLLVFLGDIFEGHGGALEHLPVLPRLQPPLGKWHVHGNHEGHGRRRGRQRPDLLARAGSRLLHNAWAEPAPGLVLAGVEDLTSLRRRSRDGGQPLAAALADRPAGATVLLSHTPWGVEQAGAAGVDLMLSGHTHGGQIWPFGLLGRAVYPHFVGRYSFGRMSLIVSRGAGTWGPRMRLWHRGEILRIVLRAK